MNIRLISLFLVTLFITSAVIAVPNASAHFTLGTQTSAGSATPNGGLPYATLPGGDCRAPKYSIGTGGDHATGHVVYVMPGTEYVPLNCQANYYSPNGSVLVDTVGDLKFYINISAYDSGSAEITGPINISACQERFLYIAIPPEFTPSTDWEESGASDMETTNRGRGDSSSVSTSITNDHRWIQVGTLKSNAIACGWNFVRISAPNVTMPTDRIPANWYTPGGGSMRVIGDTDNDGTADTFSSDLLYPAGCDPWLDRQKRTGAFKGCYEVTVKNIKAPSCAGKYFFKIFWTRSVLGAYTYYWQAPKMQVGGCLDCFISIPFENYPQLLVKGEVDPGYITGTLRYCGHSTYYYGYYYGAAITGKAGKVSAVGTALDPVTNEPIDREVCAVGYFSGTANGYYEIEGLAPGVYTLTACADGFLSQTLDTEITVKRGQSIHGVDICLKPGPKLRVKVYSKCPTGYVDWPDYTTMDTTANSDHSAYDGTVTVLGSRKTPYDTTGVPIRIEVIDADGNVKKGQGTTFTPSGATMTAPIYIGDSTCYSGIGVGWSCHVPQVNGSNTCGLEPGTYTLKGYVFGYVQMEEYSVTLPGTEFSGTSYVEMDLYKGGVVTAQVHLHDSEMTSPAMPIWSRSNRRMVLEAYDSNDELRAFNITTIPAGATTHTVRLIGDWNWWMHGGHIYGMPEDTYTFKVYVQGYVQQEFPMHTVALCSSGDFSFHIVKGGEINTTICSRDWQNPSNAVYWKHPNNCIRVEAYNSEGSKKADATITQVSGVSCVNASMIGGGGASTCGYLEKGFKPGNLPTDTYSIKAFTVGYVQKDIPEAAVIKGSSTGDIPLYLYVGGKIIVVIDYKKEEIPDPLSAGAWSYYARLKAFDEDGNLAAANITAVPQASYFTHSQYPWCGSLNPAQPAGVQTWVFELDGFNKFTTPVNTAVRNFGTAGDCWPPNYCPSCKYGYFEPGVTKTDEWKGNYMPYGIPAGTYEITMSHDGGYIQLLTVTAVVNWNGVTAVVFELDKGASISGFVWAKNWMNDYRAASWIKISATSGSGDKSTESRDGAYSISGLKPDTWTVTSELTPPGGDAGYVSESMTVTTTWGAGAGGNTFYLEESGIPIPEFPTAILALISALGASLFLMRWRRSSIVLGR